MADRKTPFARFFSSVEGHIVSRYGSGTPLGASNVPFRNNAPIGATLTAEGYVWNKDVVMAITDAEARAYKAEYDGHVRDGALLERTEDDYLAFMEAQEQAARDFEQAMADKAGKDAAAVDEG